MAVIERWRQIYKTWQISNQPLPPDAGITAALLVIAEALESIEYTIREGLANLVK